MKIAAQQEALRPVRGSARFNVDPSDRATLHFDVACGDGALGEIHSALDSVWSQNNHVPFPIRMQIDIAVTEIAANIIEHARASTLQMAVHVRSNEVEVHFRDTGHQADVDLSSVRMPDEMAERGRGLALTKMAIRELSYVRDDLSNHWKVVSNEF